MTEPGAHVCPRCDLRFALLAEVRDHLEHEHGVVWATEDALAHRAAPVPVLGGSGGIVVVPVDPSRRPSPAARVAAELARRADLLVDLVAVPPSGMTRSLVQSFLRRHGRDATAAGAPAVQMTILDEGPAAARIVDHASERKATLVCLSARGAYGLGELLLGSVSEEVVRAGVAPVLVVGPHAGDHVGCDRFAVCTDGSALADAAIPIAEDLADRLGIDVEVLRVVAPRAAAQLAEPAGNGATMTVHRTVLKRGSDPARAIVEHLERAPGTVPVCATHGRRGWRRLVPGSVALEVVRHATAPVLLVRPDV